MLKDLRTTGICSYLVEYNPSLFLDSLFCPLSNPVSNINTSTERYSGYQWLGGAISFNIHRFHLINFDCALYSCRVHCTMPHLAPHHIISANHTPSHRAECCCILNQAYVFQNFVRICACMHVYTLRMRKNWGEHFFFSCKWLVARTMHFCMLAFLQVILTHTWGLLSFPKTSS